MLHSFDARYSIVCFVYHVYASTIFYNSNIATEKLAFSVTQISFASPTLITCCVSDSFNFIKNKLDISFFLVDRGCSFH